MGRPRVKLEIISTFVSERGQATAREVAHGVQMSVPDTSRWLHHLQRSGELVIIDFREVEHASRPVAVYAPAQRDEMPAVFFDDWLRSA